MNEYGFIRMQTAGLATKQRPASSKRKPKAVVRGLVGEMSREDGYTSHMKPGDIKEPLFIRGSKEELQALPEKLVHLTKLSESMSGKKVHSHTQLAIFGVASFPVPVKRIKSDAERFQKWLELTLSFIKQFFGEENLGPLALHTDESHPHIHFTVLAQLDTLTGKIHLPWHPGRNVYLKDGPYAELSPKEKRAKYKELMSEFQDAFYEFVSKHFGWLRLDPDPRYRVDSLAEYKMRKANGTLKKKPKKDIELPPIPVIPPPVRRFAPG